MTQIEILKKYSGCRSHHRGWRLLNVGSSRFRFYYMGDATFKQRPTAEARFEFHRRLVRFWVEDYEPSQVLLAI